MKSIAFLLLPFSLLSQSEEALFFQEINKVRTDPAGHVKVVKEEAQIISQKMPVDFIQQVDANGLSLQTQDLPAASNFYQLILSDKQITQAQSYFILRILTKYKNLLNKLQSRALTISACDMNCGW